MRSSIISAIIAIIAYTVGVFLAIPMLFETGNRYGWMREIDPRTTALPLDENSAFRVALLVGGTFVCGVIGLVTSRFVSRRLPKRMVQAIGALFILLSVTKAFLLR